MIFKILLSVSLVVNGILAFYIIRQDTKPPLERIVIETHGDTIVKNKENKVVEKCPPPVKDPESEDYAQEFERLNNERLEFFTDELGFTPEQVARYQSIRKRYWDEINKSEDLDNPFVKPTPADMKRLDQNQERMLADLQKLFGKSGWDRYEKFREEANKRSWNRHERENAPFLNMDI
ncbi:MAG TPA: hypothetical protein VNJ08_09875 [Bacteriovoracaceae bacterium]|nr:hypothetical protein [Bacteriovoracaceae bacterium]